jgi:hypothetical protein
MMLHIIDLRIFQDQAKNPQTGYLKRLTLNFKHQEAEKSSTNEKQVFNGTLPAADTSIPSGPPEPHYPNKASAQRETSEAETNQIEVIETLKSREIALQTRKKLWRAPIQGFSRPID